MQLATYAASASVASKPSPPSPPNGLASLLQAAGGGGKKLMARHLATLVAIAALVTLMLALQDAGDGVNAKTDVDAVVDHQFSYCQCKRTAGVGSGTNGIPSSCNGYATSRGPGQKVVAYSYYGDSRDERVRSRYLSQIRSRAEEVRDKYPGWTVRVYFDSGEDDVEAVKSMCDVWCELDHVDFCDASNLPRPFGNLKSLMPVGT